MIEQLGITNKGRSLWLVDTVAELSQLPVTTSGDSAFVRGTGEWRDFDGVSTWTTRLAPFVPTVVEGTVASDQAMSANTYKDGPSVALTPGTWLLLGKITVLSPANTAQRVTAKLWDGTTVEDSAETASPAGGSGISTPVTLAVMGSIVIASNATWKISAASTAASSIKAAAPDNAAGNNASRLVAVKIA